MKNKEEFKKQLSILFRKYKKKLLISRTWKVRYKIFSSATDFAEVEYDYDKKDFVININMKLNMSKKHLRDTIIHELLHILLAPYVDTAMNALDRAKQGKPLRYMATKNRLDRIEEKLVQKLTKIILNLEIENES